MTKKAKAAEMPPVDLTGVRMVVQLKAMADYNQILLTRIGYAVQQGIED